MSADKPKPEEAVDADEVLRRMLSTPPKPHPKTADKAPKKPKKRAK